MSGLPDRDEAWLAGAAVDKIVTAYQEGVLRSRDEMDESGLYWLYRNLGYTEHQANHRALQTLDAAWEGNR